MSNVLDSVRYNPFGDYYKRDLQDLTEDQRKTLKRERAEQTACNRHIFAGMASRARQRLQVIQLEVAEHYMGYRLPGVENGSRGIRGKITGFSPTARVRMLKEQGSLERYPRIWQDLTFADDVMIGKSITERAKYSSRVLHYWQDWLRERFPGMWGYWKREWQIRKSGVLVGEWCPHFHVLWDWEGVSRDNYAGHCILIAGKWVSLTGSDDKGAFAVAANKESYRWLINTHMAQVYVSKYVAKVQMLEVEGSLGRFWGRIGKPRVGKRDVRKLTFTEMVWLARFQKRMLRKPRHGDPLAWMKRNRVMERRLGTNQGWMFGERETTERLLAWISEQEQKRPPGNQICPF